MVIRSILRIIVCLVLILGFKPAIDVSGLARWQIAVIYGGIYLIAELTVFRWLDKR